MKHWVNGIKEDIPKDYIFEKIYGLETKYSPFLLCHIAHVSVSGYYKHKKLILSHNTKQEREQEDRNILQELCKPRKKGYRTITMQLSRMWKPMNHKKVLRLMKKYNLLAKVRRKNPYKHMASKNQEHRTQKNILRRNFTGKTPLQKFGTDITYIGEKKNWKYLSVVRDMITGEIISHSFSSNLGLRATLKTIEELEQKLGKRKCKNILIHSDQWWHYTHPRYQAKLVNLWITQSMSRKGNCLDNAPTESFFGHMKDELEMTGKESFQELEKIIDSYIFQYNNNRPQWNKKKMTPVEYRNHLLKNKN